MSVRFSKASEAVLVEKVGIDHDQERKEEPAEGNDKREVVISILNI